MKFRFDDIRLKTLKAIRNRPDIKRVIIFGSYAKGEESRRSDVDMIIVMDTEKPFFERGKAIHTDLLKALKPLEIEFFIYTPDEFKKMLAGENRFLKRAMKALWYLHDAEPWRHSVCRLIEEFPEKKIGEQLMMLYEDAQELDRYT